MVDTRNIPAELLAGEQLVTWKRENGAKVPKNPDTGRNAKSNDPSTWATADEALAAMRHRHHAGIGRMFVKDEGITGIDLDHCIDEAGTIKPRAQAIIDRLDTYGEISPSGEGIKFWVKGSIPSNIGVTEIGDGITIEMYDHGRFFTLTGNHLPGKPKAVQPAQDVLTELHTKHSRKPTPTPEQTAEPNNRDECRADAGHVDRYVKAAVVSARAIVQAAGDHHRHDTRRDQAFSLAGYLWTGVITKQDIFDACSGNYGANQEVAEETIWSAIAAGALKPKPIPPPKVQGTSGESINGFRVFRLDDIQPVAAGDDTITLKRSDYERLKARAAAAERLEEWRQWATALIGNDQIKPTTRLFGFTQWPEYQSRQERGIDEATEWLEGRAKQAGISPRAASVAVQELAGAGLMERKETRDAKGHKRIVTGFTEAFGDVTKVATAAPPKDDTKSGWGGQREGAGRPTKDCSQCGHNAPIVEEITATRTRYCATCGAKLDEETVTHTAVCSPPTGHERSWKWIDVQPEPTDDLECRPTDQACSLESTAANAASLDVGAYASLGIIQPLAHAVRARDQAARLEMANAP